MVPAEWDGLTKMSNRDTFSGYHPIINFLYFGLVLVFSMFFTHPICLIISAVSAAAYSVYLRGVRSTRRMLAYVLPMALLAAAINPAFSHEGVTTLAYLPSGNPLTLESIAYGLAAAVMLGSVIFWFSCYNEVMTSDKFVYLFGRIIPALSLVLSMTLRFVPRFSARSRIVADARRGIGRGTATGGVLRRAMSGLTVLSVMVTWSLETAIETSDSMKSRGYGLPGRTSFSIYRFDGRDRTALAWLVFCGTYIISGWICGGLSFRYYPAMKGTPLTAFPVSFMLAYLALCVTPLILNFWEDRTWKHLTSAT